MEKNTNPQDGEWSVALREYRRGSVISLDIDPRIDLTKPIYEQAARLASADGQEQDATAA